MCLFRHFISIGKYFCCVNLLGIDVSPIPSVPYNHVGPLGPSDHEHAQTMMVIHLHLVFLYLTVLDTVVSNPGFEQSRSSGIAHDNNIKRFAVAYGTDGHCNYCSNYLVRSRKSGTQRCRRLRSLRVDYAFSATFEAEPILT